MRAVISILLLFFTLGTALAGTPATIPGCSDAAMPAATIADDFVPRSSTAPVQLAQSTCRGECSSRRGFCMSTCKDSQCRAICNSSYQSCVGSCR